MSKRIYIFVIILLSTPLILSYDYTDFFPELISNTETCLTDCEAVFEMHNPTNKDITLTNDLTLWYIQTPQANDLDEFYMQKRVNTSYQQPVWEYGTCYDYPTYNVTITCEDMGCIEENATHCECDYTCKTGKVLKDRWRYEWHNLEPAGEDLGPGQSLVFKLVGKRQPVLGQNNIDWKVKFRHKGTDYEPPWAWWNSSFGNCRNLTFDSSKVGSDLNNFPVYIKLDNTTGNFTDAQADWDDIRFINAGCLDDGDLMPYELEYSSANYAEFWVNTSLASGSDTVYSVYYNYSSAENREDGENVWNDDYMMVHHMDINASNDIVDSTSFDNDCVDSGTVAEYVGKVGYTVDFAQTGYFNCGDPSDASLDTPDNMTYEVYVNISDDDSDFQMFMTKSAGVTAGPEFRLQGNGNNFNFLSKSGGAGDFAVKQFNYKVYEWYYLAGTYNTTDLILYMNDTEADVEGYAGGVGVTANAFYIGQRTDDAVPDINATITEVRVSNVTRSEDWLFATWYSMNNSLVSMGTKESAPAAGDSTAPTWWDIDNNTASPATYNPSPNYGFQVNCTDETGMYNAFFEHNVTGSLANITCSNDTVDIFYANITSMGVSLMNYSFYCNDTSGNQNQTDPNSFQVSQASSTIKLYINGSASNSEYYSGRHINLTAVLTTPSSQTLTIFRDGVSWDSGTDPVENNTDHTYWSIGTFTMKANWTGDENYTTDDESWTLEIKNPLFYVSDGDNVTAIETEGGISTYAQWYDHSFNLSHYWFSINDTGSWANDTALAFSAVNNSWSNVTHTVNKSSEGKSVGWRIYGNNTNAEENFTAIYTFTVNNEDPTIASETRNPRCNLINQRLRYTWTQNDNNALSQSYCNFTNTTDTIIVNSTSLSLTEVYCEWSPEVAARFDVLIYIEDEAGNDFSKTDSLESFLTGCSGESNDGSPNPVIEDEGEEEELLPTGDITQTGDEPPKSWTPVYMIFGGTILFSMLYTKYKGGLKWRKIRKAK